MRNSCNCKGSLFSEYIIIVVLCQKVPDLLHAREI